MRVFVTGTGRCGSVSFAHACSFITNYTSGHETYCGDLIYPDNHIEVNPQIRKCLVNLYHKYRDAKFVHLVREPETCIPSLAALNHGSVMNAYRILHPTIMPSENANDVAYRYYWCENDCIRSQIMANVPLRNRMTLHLETIKENWPRFWKWIGAEGDFEASLKSWDTKHNTREQRGEA